MQRLSDISFSFLSTQTCTNCQLPVTCGPVYVINDLSILCGRCRMTAKDHYRNYAYEALASNFLYPCRNWRDQCPVRLRWNDSLDHELECNYTGCCTFFCSHPGAFLMGKRDMPRDEVRLTVVPENLLEYLECVICRGYLNSSPVFIQSNGQNICHRCIYANGNPPNCRRNHAYENFSQIFLFPCTYRNKGCKEKIQFGRGIWKHEAKCEYGPNLAEINPSRHRNFVEPMRPSLRPLYDQQRPSVRPNNPLRPDARQNDPCDDLSRPSETSSDQQRPSARPKERGVIKTHTGHIWATITPNKALFAPRDDNYNDVDIQLLKSMAKKQGRKIRRADDIGNQMGRRNSDSESISTNESYNMKTNGTNTPDHLESLRRPYIPPEDYFTENPPLDSRPSSRESGYQTGPLTPKHSEDHGYNRGLKSIESFRDMEGPGQYPVLQPHQLSDGFDSVKRVSKRESARGGNTLLINELKMKQDIIKRTHSIKGDKDSNSTYINQSNNLDDIMEMNHQLR